MIKPHILFDVCTDDVRNSFSQQDINTSSRRISGNGSELSWTIGVPFTATTNVSDFNLTQRIHKGQPETKINNQELSFSEDWNIISTRVIPENRNMTDVFQKCHNAFYLNPVMRIMKK